MRHTIKLQQSGAPIRNKVRRAVDGWRMFLWGGSPKQYFPEAHYMRGPGPKWLEKHGGLQEGFQSCEGTHCDQRKVECVRVKCTATARCVGAPFAMRRYIRKDIPEIVQLNQ
jgi:hypothetical protein